MKFFLFWDPFLTNYWNNFYKTFVVIVVAAITTSYLIMNTGFNYTKPILTMVNNYYLIKYYLFEWSTKFWDSLSVSSRLCLEVDCLEIKSPTWISVAHSSNQNNGVVARYNHGDRKNRYTPHFFFEKDKYVHEIREFELMSLICKSH